MTKSERNNAFSKMLKEFPKVFGRISFRERLMLGVAFDYAITETHDLENKLLGERCNQLLKDRGYLTDKLQGLKEILAQTIENDEVAYETLKLHDQEEIGMLNSKVAELENKIADIKANCDLAIEGREVKIKELEKENAELKDDNKEIKKMKDEEMAEEYYYKNVFAETNPKSETELKEKFLQTFQDGAEFGYNKANEWHNVKDENPDNGNDILCQISKDEVEVGYYHTKEKRYYTIDGKPIDVIRWQEIVFPKESE